jgi:hypothetical protein
MCIRISFKKKCWSLNAMVSNPASDACQTQAAASAATSASKGGLGVVSGSASGGKVLPKEEISDELRAFLKVS